MKWSRELGCTIDVIDWTESYPECMKWTICTKLRAFYFQYRMQDIMTNSKLYKMNLNMLKTDPKCDWCTSTTQDMIHLFWECKYVTKLWIDLTNWINSWLDNGHLEIKKEMVFLFDIDAGNYTTIINLLMLISLRYIYMYVDAWELFQIISP